MANITRLKSSLGFSDQSVNGFTLPTQFAGVPGIPGGAADFGGFDQAGFDAPFNPFGGFTGFGGNQLDQDIDFGMDIDAANQASLRGLPNAGDIRFGTNTDVNTGMPADTDTEPDVSNSWSISNAALSLRKLMANVMRQLQYYSPSIDGGDTDTANYGAGDINYGGSDLNSDAPTSPSQPAQSDQSTDKPVAAPDGTTTYNARAASGGAAAPGPTYVDPDPALLAEIAQREKTDPAGAAKLRELAAQPVTHWLNGTPYDAQHLGEYLDKAQAAGKEGSVMFYNIPGRDNGGYSGGGAKSVGEYKAWAKQMSDVIGDRKTTVYLETDAIMLTKDMSPEKADERLRLIGDTVDMIKKNNPNATVVLNAGSAGWGNPADTAALLKRANVQNADGFFLNVAGFESTADSMHHGDAIVSELDKLGITGKRYIIDTSRNGAKIMAQAGTPEAWADPYGAASGTKPTTDQALIQNPNVMALTWVKTPWNSDGRLSNAGAMVADYAIKLVENAHQLGI